jgi:hypothetical protein
MEFHVTSWNFMESYKISRMLSGLGPKLTCIGAKLVGTLRHVYLSFRMRLLPRVAIRLSTNLRPALSLTSVALQ